MYLDRIRPFFTRVVLTRRHSCFRMLSMIMMEALLLVVDHLVNPLTRTLRVILHMALRVNLVSYTLMILKKAKETLNFIKS